MSKFPFLGMIDTTLRDGQQSPLLFASRKYRFDLEDKKLLVQGLIHLGIRHIELFSPVVSEVESEDFAELRRYAKAISGGRVMLIAHARCQEDDIRKAIEAGYDGLNLYMAVSKFAQNYSYGRTFEEIFRIIKNTLRKTRLENPNLYIRFSIEDSFRTPMQDLFAVYDEVAEYVNTFGMPDTVGIATPSIVARRARSIKLRYPQHKLECHFHNDRGYSLVNAITAVRSGVEFVDTSIWGLAERSGITSMGGFLLNLRQISKEACEQYNLDLCYPLNVLMSSILKIDIPFTEPVSPTNRTHTAGVHQKAVLNNRKVYEGHDLDLFGVCESQILLGPLSGWNSIYHYLQREGHNVSVDYAKNIAAEYKRRAGHINSSLAPEALLNQILIEFPAVSPSVVRRGH